MIVWIKDFSADEILAPDMLIREPSMWSNKILVEGYFYVGF